MTTHKKSFKNKLGLSLSGGGVKAVIYLGVIEALEEAGIDIDVIGGLSGGSLVASLYATGLSVKQIIQLSQDLHLWGLMDKNPLNGYTFLDQTKVYKQIKDIVGDKKIEDLDRKIVIVASDLKEKVPVLISTGELAAAITASCCLPPILPPFTIDDRTFVDGGFSIKYGAEYYRALGADVVVGVNLDQWLTDEQLPGVARSFVQSIRILIEANARKEQLLNPVDVEIRGFSDTSTMLDFDVVKHQLDKLGYERTKAFLPQIKEKLGL